MVQNGGGGGFSAFGSAGGGGSSAFGSGGIATAPVAVAGGAFGSGNTFGGGLSGGNGSSAGVGMSGGRRSEWYSDSILESMLTSEDVIAYGLEVFSWGCIPLVVPPVRLR